MKNSLDGDGNAISINDNEFTSDQITNQRNFYETKNYNNIQTIKNTSYFDSIESETRNFDLEEKQRKNLADRMMIQVGKSLDSQKSQDKNLAEEMNENIKKTIDRSLSASSRESHESAEFKHINTPYSNDAEMIISKMNSPPIWRTVLG
jgi:heterodisulfide reductase subunit B